MPSSHLAKWVSWRGAHHPGYSHGAKAKKHPWRRPSAYSRSDGVIASARSRPSLLTEPRPFIMPAGPGGPRMPGRRRLDTTSRDVASNCALMVFGMGCRTREASDATGTADGEDEEWKAAHDAANNDDDDHDGIGGG